VIVARWIFFVAGIVGMFEVVTLLMIEDLLFQGVPKNFRVHPEFLYGFVGVTFAWQVAFIFIGLEPTRLRPIMIPAIVEKATFVIAVLWLYIAGRVGGETLIFGGIDLLFAVLFVFAWLITPDIEADAENYAPE
jgi:hypothetical protein